jgi:hypothetical protein
MLFASEIFFLLFFQDFFDNTFDLVDESFAIGHGFGVFDDVSAMGTLRFDNKGLFNAGLTVDFGTVGTHHDFFGNGVTDLAGD